MSMTLFQAQHTGKCIQHHMIVKCNYGSGHDVGPSEQQGRLLIDRGLRCITLRSITVLVSRPCLGLDYHQ